MKFDVFVHETIQLRYEVEAEKASEAEKIFWSGEYDEAAKGREYIGSTVEWVEPAEEVEHESARN